MAAVTVTGEQQAQRGPLTSQPQGPAVRPSPGRGLEGLLLLPGPGLGSALARAPVPALLPPPSDRHEAGPGPSLPWDRGSVSSACTWMQLSRTLSS